MLRIPTPGHRPGKRMAGWRVTDETRALALWCLALQRRIVRARTDWRGGGAKTYTLEEALRPALERWARALTREAERLGIDPGPAPRADERTTAPPGAVGGRVRRG